MRHKYKYTLSLIVILIIVFSCIQKSYSLTVDFSYETFELNNIAETDKLDSVGILDGYTTLLQPANGIYVEKREDIKTSTYCNKISLLSGSVVDILGVFHGGRIDWLYIKDTETGLDGWVDGGQFYILPDGIRTKKATTLDLDEIIIASSTGYILSGDGQNLAIFEEATSGDIEHGKDDSPIKGFIDATLTEEEMYTQKYGLKKITIDTGGVFYDSIDKYQILLTAICMIFIVLLSIYTYTAIWGETSEDTMLASIISSITIIISTSMTLLLIHNIIGLNTKIIDIDTLFIIVLMSPVLLGMIINAVVLSEIDRVGKPIKYSICIYGLIYSILLFFTLIYNRDINPEFMQFLTQSRYMTSTNSVSVIQTSEVTTVFSIMVLFIFIAVNHRYNFSFSLEKQAETAARMREIMEIILNETYHINEYILPKKFKDRPGYLSKRYYKDGLPTLQDMLTMLKKLD